MKRFAPLAAARGLVALLLAGWLWAGTAQAGGRLPCEAPQIFSAAAVNVLVLPYRDARTNRQDRGSAGWRLATLVQQETLLALLKYQSIGVTELTAESGLCDVRQVLQQVTRGQGNGQLAPGRALVVIWGRVYQEGEDIYVQSYLRFLRKGQAESVQATVGPLRLSAELQTTALAMAPRRLAQRDLEALEARARQSLMLHRSPGGAVQGPLADANEPVAYAVLAAQGEWMRVRSTVTGREGWMRARADADGWALRRLLPELGYLDAVVGYLRLRGLQQPPAGGDPRVLHGWMRTLLEAHERAVGSDAAPAALALGRVMLGLAQWHVEALGPEAERRRRASALFDEASRLAPEVADYRNLSAVASPFAAPFSGPGAPDLSPELAAQLDGTLLGALALDAEHRGALGNLERLYAALEAQAAAPGAKALYENPVLTQRLDVVRKSLQGTR
jgi:hypothetical protein